MKQLKSGYGIAPVEGGEISYFIEGKGPPIAGTHPYWSPKKNGYPAIPGFTTITVYPRGFGKSSRARNRYDYGFWRLSDDLDAVRNHLQLEKWIYWGVSYGGMTGQVYALKYQHTLHALILDGTAPSWHYRDDPNSIWPRVQKSPEAAAYRSNPNPKTFRDFWNVIQHLGMNKWGFPKNMIEQEHNPEALAECIRRITEYDVREDLKSLRIPVLVLVGEKDPSCPPSQARIISNVIPGAKLKIFPGIGHGVRFHNPPGLMELVNEFTRNALEHIRI
jgi:pimeloyl-ACP methyl ester carboxylesterase